MKHLSALFLFSSVMGLTACGNLSKVTVQGTAEEVVWPKIEDSSFNHSGSQFGSWPNWQNLRMVEAGMNKDQIYNLLGRPHFSEGLWGVREWDYVFNYREDGEHKVCQYKILFDKQMNAQTFLWNPSGCNSKFAVTLSSEYLFEFDKATLTKQGKHSVDLLAEQLNEKGTEIKEIKVSGFTDRLGSTAYNLNLSQKRAEQVKKRLETNGITVPIFAKGYGEAHQVKACNGSGQALKDCLAPNRRVEIVVSGLVNSDITKGLEPESQGPALLYQE
ncbi:OmpA family protein [Rodentibacter myodis]|uniref:Plastocyanin n=1 Tax=Rodentibacter myodis TaxID=1907939 RepID=A0A1V3JQX5_9PAST|nr:OmpA family protein [Rodentibacter myodis]OOF58790.1 plastocyanin [Rodentibacter myodis]